MVLPGHLAGGYIVTTAILKFIPGTEQFSNNEIALLYIIGILSGEIPDIDLLFFYLSKKINKNSKKTTHREFYTHLPLFWLIISTLIIILGYVINSSFIILIAIILLGGTFSHLIFDSIEYGIRWLGPFSKKHFSLLKIKENFINDKKDITVGSIPYYWNYIKKSYIKNKTIYFEIIVVIIAITIYLY
jgi:inner membrane protein